jgi:TrmH family RNA methyltransferase
MWSISRVKIFYTDLEKYLRENKLDNQVCWAFLTWENIHNLSAEKNNNWFIIIGNESHGISNNLEKFITKKITIPSFWDAESLNAWVATGIIIDNFKRKT